MLESLCGGAVVKNLPANARDAGLIPGSERAPGEENGNPLQYSCLENFMDREAWWATVHGVIKQSNTTGHARIHTHTYHTHTHTHTHTELLSNMYRVNLHSKNSIF